MITLLEVGASATTTVPATGGGIVREIYQGNGKTSGGGLTVSFGTTATSYRLMPGSLLPGGASIVNGEAQAFNVLIQS